MFKFKTSAAAVKHSRLKWVKSASVRDLVRFPKNISTSLLQLEIWWDFTKIFLIPWSHYFLFLPHDPDPDIAFLFCEEMSSFPSINLFLLQLMAPQEASWTQTNPRNQEDFWPRSEIWDFWKSVSSSSFWSVLGEEKVTQKLKTGDVVMILAMSVYLDFKKQILPTTIT